MAWDFNHPAPMVHFDRAVHWLSGGGGPSFPFWLRLPAILADAGSLWLVWRLLGPRRHERSLAWALLVLAVSPTLVLVSGFHGNTDSVMVLFLLLSVLLVEDGRGTAAGAAFALACGVKVVPLVAAPALLLSLRGLRSRAAFLASAAVTVLVTWSPYLWQDPGAILAKVLGYRSLYGHWGLSFLASRAAPLGVRSRWLDAELQRFGPFLAMGAVLALTLLVNRSGWRAGAPERPRASGQVGLALLLFLTLTSGFGVQYLAWLPVFVVELGALASAAYAATSGVFLFLVYDLWAQGLPWDLADSNRVGDYAGRVDGPQLLCWLTVAALLWVALRRLVGRPRPSAAPTPERLATAGICAVIVFLPLAVRLAVPREGPRYGTDAGAVEAIRAGQARELEAYLAGKRRTASGAPR